MYQFDDIPFIFTKKSWICSEPLCLDIETSNNHAADPKDLITWITSIQVLFNGKYYLFRTPEDFIEYLLALIKRYGLRGRTKENRGIKIICFIHNSSYDLSYLIPYFIKYLPNDGLDKSLIENVNKFLTYVQGGLEFRCTYRLTNMSLNKWSNIMNTEHKKQIGLYDYNKIIYPDDKLTEDELSYDKYDVLSLYDCINKQNEYHKDNLATMPLTMTGYVRRLLRQSCRKDYFRTKYFTKSKLSTDLYKACIMAYSGGFTHNNRFYKDMVIQKGQTVNYCGKSIKVNNIGHRDFKSHYPSQMLCYRFPVGSPKLFYDATKYNNDITIDDILDLSPKYSTMTLIQFYNVELIDYKISMPFMQFSKCNSANFRYKLLDNGRIIKATGSWLMALDNLTLSIIRDQYNMEYSVIKSWKIKNGYLPTQITDIVNQFFKGKSDNKNIVNELTDKYGKLHEETIQANFDLMQSKILLNSIYGCTATNPIRTNYDINDLMEFYLDKSIGSDDDIADSLDKFYSSRSSFLPFQYGVWITAAARFELYEYIKVIGYENILYCDTDSIFYIKSDETEYKIEQLNDIKHKSAQYVELNNGSLEYYDCFTSEPDCIAFKGLHSKCYGVVTSHGLELTIAGVPSRTLVDMVNDEPVYVTREDELRQGEQDDIKALDHLKDGFKFKINTGVSALYIGSHGLNSDRVPEIVEVNGHKVSTAGGCVIRPLKEKVVHDIFYDVNIDINRATINNYTF